jgi:hypothetical protein
MVWKNSVKRMSASSTKPPRRRPERHADDKRDGGRHDAEEERDARAVHEARHDVAPECVGSERKALERIGREERPPDEPPRRRGIEDGSKRRDGDHRQQHQAADHRAAVAHEPPEEAHPATSMRGSAAR